ncbi:HAD family hydrolase [Segatella paludivivens]|uniref:HAD family hydrolase n=1 Tax=Segatella paludivivens TaxID=185294 RepID=UPI0003708702|nr:HAD family hydrolase [Segatella paludivivens]
MKYKHLLFDIDGTLVDNESAVINTWQQTIQELVGRHFEKDELTFVLGIPGVTTMKKLGIENSEEAFARWSELFQEHRNEISLFDGIEEMINELKNKQYKLGLITSRTRDELSNDDALCKIFHLFDIAICVTDTAHPKPSADPILAYFEKTGATPAETLYVGDAAYDSQCAVNANVDFALATWGNAKKGISCKYQFDMPHDLIELLL